MSDCGEWVIEFRSGSFFQSLDADNGGPAKTAQQFATYAEADAFVDAHTWIAFNGGMPYPLERAVRSDR
jgi:hypothetical protein